MLDALDAFFSSLVRTLRIADVLDVALVALFLYLLIAWLRQDTARPTARRAVLVLLIFIGINGLADTFELYLTEQVLQLLLVVFLVAAVVVFQSDIRRLLDRIGSWSFFRRPFTPSKTDHVIDVITETAADMAEQYCGALIAVKGKEPWDRLIHGGIALGGEVSQPLLQSIFDPSTPGHDGVALIENNRVSRFAAHLPLTQNLPEASRFGGTRHAAALGLSEQCDALVVIVSEERGTISVAEGDRIVELDSASELKARLEQFWRKHHDRRGTTTPRAVLRHRMQTAALSLALSMTLWLLFAYSQDTGVQSFTVPVSFRNVPPDWTLGEINPAEARVVVAGSERAFRLLDESSLNISFDLSEPTEGESEFVINEGNLNLPSELRLDNVEPQSVRVMAHQLLTVPVPVRVRLEGTLPDTLARVLAVADPDTLVLRLPGSVEQPRLLWTQPVDLGQVEGSAELRRKVLLRPEYRLAPNQSDEVTVRLQVTGTVPAP